MVPTIILQDASATEQNLTIFRHCFSGNFFNSNLQKIKGDHAQPMRLAMHLLHSNASWGLHIELVDYLNFSICNEPKKKSNFMFLFQGFWSR